MDSALQHPRRAAALTAVACAAMLAVFAAVSWSAQAGKGFTFDEPLHGLGAWLNLRHGDYRVAYELPPLWKYWAALPTPAGALRVDFSAPRWRAMPGEPGLRWPWSNDVLFRTPGNEADAFLRRQRVMMLVVGVALGAALALLAWRLGGAAAALAAAALYALDPNFIGHAPIIKDDVAAALVFLLTLGLLWRMGRGAGFASVVAMGVLWGAGMTVKGSAGAFAAAALLLFGLRAALPTPWPVLGTAGATRRARWAGAAAASALAAAVAWATIWAAYGFRFGPSPDPSVRLDTSIAVTDLAKKTIGRQTGAPATAAQLAAWTPPPDVRLLRRAEALRLLPQAFIAGLLNTRALSAAQDVYLLRQVNDRGWWYYFPVAFATKVPLATLAALLGSGVWAAVHAWLRRDRWLTPAAWPATCGLVACGVYGAALVRSPLDVGFRYAFPLYAAMLLVPAVAASWAWRAAAGRPRARRAALAGGGVLLLGLAIESARAYPDDLAFFNAAAGGARGGLAILGDSNLDWGQDLPLLARWQRDHPGVLLYLSYFGREDPASRAIGYVNLPGGFKYGPPYQWPDAPGVIAVGATQLQEIYLPPSDRPFYDALRRRAPLDVLGGTIYLYDFPPGSFRKRP